MNERNETLESGEGNVSRQAWTQVVLAGMAGWVVVSIGFLGLNILMQERPQFVGQPARGAEVALIQESPRLLLRKVSDDVAMVKESQPSLTQINFDMMGRRDYRGLQTIMDMTGRFRGVYTVSNSHDGAVFVLFKCPHPRAESRSGVGGFVNGLQLEASREGLLEVRGDAWIWTGELGAGEDMVLEISYEASNLIGVRYQIAEQSVRPISPHRVTIRHQDLPGIHFESADGRGESNGEMMVWERGNFLPPDFFSGRITKTRNLFSSLEQLLDIGPALSLMFLVTAVAGDRVSEVFTSNSDPYHHGWIRTLFSTGGLSECEVLLSRGVARCGCCTWATVVELCPLVVGDTDGIARRSNPSDALPSVPHFGGVFGVEPRNGAALPWHRHVVCAYTPTKPVTPSTDRGVRLVSRLLHIRPGSGSTGDSACTNPGFCARRKGGVFGFIWKDDLSRDKFHTLPGDRSDGSF